MSLFQQGILMLYQLLRPIPAFVNLFQQGILVML
jgi:hypothetical protein